MRAVALALAILAACGRSGFDPISDAGAPDASPITNPAPSNFTAGTRLRPNIYRGGDVTRRYAWHDTVLDVDCAAVVADDGVTRCVPFDASTQYIYSDPACTIALGFRESSLDACAPPKYSTVRINDVWTVRTVIGPHVGPVYSNTTGTCATTSTNALLDLGPVVPANTLLGAHQELTRNHDLSYTETVFDDGARELEPDVFDHANGGACLVFPLSTDQGMCLPVDIETGALYYKDPACTDGVVSVVDASKPFELQRGDVCGDSRRVFQAGAPYTDPVFKLGAGGCALEPNPPPTYELVTPDHDIFPRMQRTLRPGPGPVREARWTTPDGFDLGTVELWNDQRNEWCTPFVDGVTSQLICGPSDSSLEQAIYGDATCSTIVDTAVATCVETGGSRYYPTSSNFRVCDGMRWLPAVNNRPVATPAFMLSERGCTVIPASATLLGPSFSIGVDATQYPPVVRE